MSFSNSSGNSNNTLMGFSVHQPSIGAALQFFPSMGSAELDQLIDAYVPGNASILDKRTQVSIEFFEHSMNTGELFKFFMVFPTFSAASTTESPASTLMDSGYGSSFNTSPVMSENQGYSAKAQSKSRTSSKKAAVGSADFSSMPGMKIMTKDGQDVTNSASRGCKTKEQRDHAHLMRIMKACEACKKKKIRCDPSHKRSSPQQSSSKVTKKTKRASASQPAPSVPVFGPSPSSTAETPVDSVTPESMTLDQNEDLTASLATNTWDEFIQYPEDFNISVPDFDFTGFDFFDQNANYQNVDYSPMTSFASGSSFSSPSRSVDFTTQPAGTAVNAMNTGDNTAMSNVDLGGVDHGDGFGGTAGARLPYNNPGGTAMDGVNDYVDFNLYSPGSSLDEDFGGSSEMAAASPRSSRSSHHQRPSRRDSSSRHDDYLEGVETFAIAPENDRTSASLLDSLGAPVEHRSTAVDHVYSVEGDALRTVTGLAPRSRSRVPSDRPTGASKPALRHSSTPAPTPAPDQPLARDSGLLYWEDESSSSFTREEQRSSQRGIARATTSHQKDGTVTRGSHSPTAMDASESLHSSLLEARRSSGTETDVHRDVQFSLPTSIANASRTTYRLPDVAETGTSFADSSIGSTVSAPGYSIPSALTKRQRSQPAPDEEVTQRTMPADVHAVESEAADRRSSGGSVRDGRLPGDVKMTDAGSLPRTSSSTARQTTVGLSSETLHSVSPTAAVANERLGQTSVAATGTLAMTQTSVKLGVKLSDSPRVPQGNVRQQPLTDLTSVMASHFTSQTVCAAGLLASTGILEASRALGITAKEATSLETLATFTGLMATSIIVIAIITAVVATSRREEPALSSAGRRLLASAPSKPSEDPSTTCGGVSDKLDVSVASTQLSTSFSLASKLSVLATSTVAAVTDRIAQIQCAVVGAGRRRMLSTTMALSRASSPNVNTNVVRRKMNSTLAMR